jgi:hypothetical protein
MELWLQFQHDSWCFFRANKHQHGSTSINIHTGFNTDRDGDFLLFTGDRRCNSLSLPPITIAKFIVELQEISQVW